MGERGEGGMERKEKGGQSGRAGRLTDMEMKSGG